uniref:protein-tyrosine-phosphatase n=1 Tax=Astyanax mexicanus TaxID=7994 RepID=A0A3B1IIP7_ASTMX
PQHHLLCVLGRCHAKMSTGSQGQVSLQTRIRQQNGSLKEKYGLTTETGGLKENIKKNRYKDILPYDQTRIYLSPTPPEYNSDYINASFLTNKTYIATQGPLSSTVVDFWRMTWQYNVQVIVMACKEFEMGKKKCEVYWGSLSEPSTFGPFTVSTSFGYSALPADSGTHGTPLSRLLRVYFCLQETRTVSHFQYTAWPDHGIPYVPDGILGMMELTSMRQRHHTGPLLVHCSAGCGRTGVICAIDYINDLLQQKKIDEDFSIMDIVLDLRRQRPAAVQTKEQYEFVFHTVAQMFEKFLKQKQRGSPSFYSNVVPPKPAVRSVSIGGNRSFDPTTRKPPLLRPRSSHPPPSTKMNDTYAVVNKSRHSAAPATIHHYDNLDSEKQKTPNNALYSTVKPKIRPAGTPPVPDRTAGSSNQRRPVAPSELGHCGYESLPGEEHLLLQVLFIPDSHSSTDDDYEYVSNVSTISNVSNTNSYSAPGGMGFNCRIKKPKGPRDPPAEWNRPER